MKAMTRSSAVLLRVLSSAFVSSDRISVSRLSRAPMTRTRTFSRCNSSRSRWMKSLRSPMRSRTSSSGRPQFSD
ncbi:hypothetical protein COL154_013987, partial [Colletotrichum chrysophilum]